MKKLQKLLWAALGAALFLSVNLILTFGTAAPVRSIPPEAIEMAIKNQGLETLNSTETATQDSSFSKEEVLRFLLAQSPEEVRFQQLAEGDRLYLQGQTEAAERIYRQAKPPFSPHTSSGSGDSADSAPTAEAIVDPEQLSPAGRVFWREARAGWEHEPRLESRLFVSLEMLIEKHPEFLPGQLLYVEALQEYDRKEEALEILDRVAALYPDEPGLIKFQVQALEEQKEWLEASISARQFALLYPEHEWADEAEKIADEDLKKFRGGMKRKLIGQAILSGAINIGDYLLTGNASGGIPTLQLTLLLLQGEGSFGKQMSEAIKQQYQGNNALVEDKEILDYINSMGNKIANLMGRDEFEYEFNVVADKNLNAFALPGGKVFVNTGAILNTDSEAELAGLLGHEVAHAVLSHGYQRIAKGALLSNLNRVIPYGDFLAELLSRRYSRQHEQQSDILGTRVLSGANYAADGVRNLMMTLDDLYGDKAPPRWLSTHPPSSDRVEYLEDLIETAGYNRYAYEGVTKHAQIQNRVKQLVEDDSESS